MQKLRVHAPKLAIWIPFQGLVIVATVMRVGGWAGGRRAGGVGGRGPHGAAWPLPERWRRCHLAAGWSGPTRLLPGHPSTAVQLTGGADVRLADADAASCRDQKYSCNTGSGALVLAILQLVFLGMYACFFLFFLFRAFRDHEELPFARYRVSNLAIRLVVRARRCGDACPLCWLGKPRAGAAPLLQGRADGCGSHSWRLPPSHPLVQARHGTSAFFTTFLSVVVLTTVHFHSCWSYLDAVLGLAPVEVGPPGCLA